MNIKGSTYSSNLFATSASQKSMIAEISTLEANGSAQVFSQIYDDACDVGFIIHSEKTSMEATFYLDETFRNSDGDTLEWLLLPTLESQRKFPCLNGFKVVVIND